MEFEMKLLVADLIQTCLKIDMLIHIYMIFLQILNNFYLYLEEEMDNVE